MEEIKIQPGKIQKMSKKELVILFNDRACILEGIVEKLQEILGEIKPIIEEDTNLFPKDQWGNIAIPCSICGEYEVAAMMEGTEKGIVCLSCASKLE